MYDLFKTIDGIPVLSPELKLLQPFKAILKRKEADGIFAYIYFLYAYNSPFNDQDPSTKETKIKELLGLPVTFTEDAEVKAAVELYKTLSYTISMAILDTSRRALFLSDKIINKYMQQLEGLVDLKVELSTEEQRKQEDERIKSIIDKVNSLNTLITKIPTNIEAIDKVQNNVIKEVTDGKSKKKVVDRDQLPS